MVPSGLRQAAAWLGLDPESAEGLTGYPHGGRGIVQEADSLPDPREPGQLRETGAVKGNDHCGRLHRSRGPGQRQEDGAVSAVK